MYDVPLKTEERPSCLSHNHSRNYSLVVDNERDVESKREAKSMSLAFEHIRVGSGFTVFVFLLI